MIEDGALALAGAGLIVVVATALSRVLARLRQPPVMGEVLAGLVLGASLLGTLPGDPSAAIFTPGARDVLGTLGSIALVGYVFIVVAELDLGALRREGHVVRRVAVASFVVPWLAGAGVAIAVHGSVAGDPPPVAFVVFLATAFSVTAFPILARIVGSRGLVDRPAGRIALAAAAGQELVVWPVLGLAVALGGRAADPPEVVLVLGSLALVLTVVLSRVVVPRVPDRLAAPAALAGLAVAAVATQLTGLHLVLGAFVFAITLRERDRRATCSLLRTRPLRAAGFVLLPLYFALPALRVDVGALEAGDLGLLAVVLVVAISAKSVSAALAARSAGVARPEAQTIGALMNARGLVELVVLSVGLSAGLIDERLFTVMVLMALVTTFLTGPLTARLNEAPRQAPRPIPLFLPQSVPEGSSSS